MSSAYFHHLFGATARALQARAGSRTTYARREASEDARDVLTERELDFLHTRDSVYLASVTAEGWPYVQHRGGPAGFIRSLGENRIGFSDYPGNRQYISLGNVIERGRVALFAMDYAARRRLKLIGHARIVTAAGDPDIVEQVSHVAAPPAEAALLIDVVGFDWNCPQFITPRFTRDEVAAAVTARINEAVEHELGPLQEENARLRAEIARLKGAPA